MNKKVVIGTVVVVAVVVGLVAWRWQAAPSAETPGQTAATTTGSVASSSSGTPAKKTPPNLSGITYTEAVTRYGNVRMQIDPTCTISPNAFTVKNGTNVMFDNRSQAAKTVTVLGTRYSIGAFSFKIVTLRSATLPRVATIDCGSGRNNAQITLQ